MSESTATFRVGLTPDFPAEAAGRYETEVAGKFDGVEGLSYEVMPNYEALGDYDAVLALKINIDAATLTGVSRTAIVARWGVGYDSIDTQAMTDADIALAITPNGVKRPVAEAILTLIFALAKQIFRQDRMTRQGRWRDGLSEPTICLEGRTLGSVGCGNIARELFRLSDSLGFGQLLACDPYADPVLAAGLGIKLVSMEELFSKSDFVTVNTLLNEETRGLIGAEHFRLMKPTAYFINTARGPIVHESDLIEALREKRFAGAGVDVFEQEPPAKDNPLFELDNVIVSPHGLAWTQEISRDNTREACDNILAVFAGEPPPGLVNREVTERPGFEEKLARRRT